MKQTKKQPPAPAHMQIRTWKTRQAAHYEQIAALGKFKIKLEIKRDSYDFQSYAVASVFAADKLAWNVVYTIPYPNMASLSTVNAYAEFNSGHFVTDVRKLTTGIQAILF
jgi:hypothetical protein